MPKEIKFKRYSSKAILLMRANSGSASSDFFSAENKIIRPLSPELKSTNSQMSIPEGYYERMAGRSNIFLK